ncbi:nucleotidyltransferase domain-containing protein [Emticicia sp. SJ17W-69]|uniref:nucleotidyltransferase domain-containing protein n=1 Tax=Emticicia sp. SJ17W-69 TaxID=3421657 RepID=UPI003EC03704
MLPIVQQIATEFKAELEKLYGDELADLILFGSHARGDFHDESDIDFAVVLKNPATTSTSEIMKVSDVGNDLSIKYGQFITYIGMPEFKLKQSNLSIYQEIRKDGIRI